MRACHAGRATPWGIARLGLVTLVAGSALFAFATWRTGIRSRAGTALLALAGIFMNAGRDRTLPGLHPSWDPW